MIAGAAEDIRVFIVTRLAPHLEPSRVGEGTPLLEDGVLESLHMLDLVLFLEERFSVRIPPIDITPDNFATIRQIVGLVERCR